MAGKIEKHREIDFEELLRDGPGTLIIESPPCAVGENAVIRKKEDRPEAADHSRSKTHNQRRIDFLRSTAPRGRDQTRLERGHPPTR